MNKLSINIPSPCTEDWHQMTDCGLGKFCGSCRKTVVDFTGYTDSEIVRYVNNHKGELCGRFTTDQLNRTLIEPSAPISGNWFFRFISGLLMLGGAKEALAEAPEVKLEMVADTAKINLMDDNTIEKNDSTVSRKIKGKVVDSHSGEEIVGAIINGKVSTDINGNFEIEVPILEKDSVFTITVQHVGYMPETIIINSNRVSEIFVDLKVNGRVMAGVVQVSDLMIVGALEVKQKPRLFSNKRKKHE